MRSISATVRASALSRNSGSVFGDAQIEPCPVTQVDRDTVKVIQRNSLRLKGFDDRIDARGCIVHPVIRSPDAA